MTAAERLGWVVVIAGLAIMAAAALSALLGAGS